MIKDILNKIKKSCPKLTERMGYALLPKSILNINIDVCNPKQDRVLILYSYMMGIDYSYIRHANVLQATQIIHYFVSRDFCVDYCFYNDWYSFDILRNRKYDVIIGQGMMYKALCKDSLASIKICILSENHPETVKRKYEERLLYFRERHPHTSLKESIARTDILDVEQFKLSTHGILMNSKFNADNYKEFDHLYLVNSNAMFNQQFCFDEMVIMNYINASKNRVLWFGSGGIIHKGLDILMDVVREMPDIELNCYGVKAKESKLFKHLSGPNTHNRGHVNVMSDDFYREVVLKHNFVVFPSCSEGMATSVATCMAYGIIPVVTKETGFNPCDCIIILDDYKKENIKEAIIKMRSLPDDEILNLRKQCYHYARNNFSLKHFDESFTEIMNNILISKKKYE
jgi:hypothetical protein